jgi:isocitrate/isopropylmalate dehydrogenase
LESAVLDVYASGSKADLTPDVGGTGTTNAFTEAVCKRL